VDHADGNGLNNQRWNLRVATKRQQQANRGKQRNGRTSQYKGVFWDKSRERWSATIHYDHKTRYLGRYRDEEDAAHAYDLAALESFGSFARLNFPVLNGVACLRHQLGIPDAFCAC
jgi:AP2 domain-containing protein